MSEVRNGYIKTLDGWRAVAILFVLVNHSTTLLQQTNTPFGYLAARLAWHASYGVDIFFAISGFLITHLLLKEKDRAGSIDLGAFYQRRFFRIIPPIIPYLVTLGLLSAAGYITVTSSEVGAVLLFVRNYADGNWYTGHFWSLAIEEHFYLVVPFVIALCRKRTGLWVAGALAAICIITRYFEWRAGLNIEFRTETRFDALMYGAIFAILLNAPRSRSVLERHLTLAVTLALVMAAMFLANSSSLIPVRRTMVTVAMPLLVIYTVLRPNEMLGRLLEAAWLRWIGRLSFSIYIWQTLFFAREIQMPSIQHPLMAIAGTTACAIASYYLVEQRFVAIGRRLMANRTRGNPNALNDSASA